MIGSAHLSVISYGGLESAYHRSPIFIVSLKLSGLRIRGQVVEAIPLDSRDVNLLRTSHP